MSREPRIAVSARTAARLRKIGDFTRVARIVGVRRRDVIAAASDVPIRLSAAINIVVGLELMTRRARARKAMAA